MAVNIIVNGTLRRTDDFKYTSAAIVPGASDIMTVTRDYDAYDPSISVNVSVVDQSFYSPTSGETGTFFCTTYDSDGKYTYQEFTYDAALNVSEITANKLTDGTKVIVIAKIMGALAIHISAGTGVCKIRIDAVKE